jgi:hypothetical protein
LWNFVAAAQRNIYILWSSGKNISTNLCATNRPQKVPKRIAEISGRWSVRNVWQCILSRAGTAMLVATSVRLLPLRFRPCQPRCPLQPPHNAIANTIVDTDTDTKIARSRDRVPRPRSARAHMRVAPLEWCSRVAWFFSQAPQCCIKALKFLNEAAMP